MLQHICARRLFCCPSARVWFPGRRNRFYFRVFPGCIYRTISNCSESTKEPTKDACPILRARAQCLERGFERRSRSSMRSVWDECRSIWRSLQNIMQFLNWWLPFQRWCTLNRQKKWESKKYFNFINHFLKRFMNLSAKLALSRFRLCSRLHPSLKLILLTILI